MLKIKYIVLIYFLVEKTTILFSWDNLLTIKSFKV